MRSLLLFWPFQAHLVTVYERYPDPPPLPPCESEQPYVPYDAEEHHMTSPYFPPDVVAFYDAPPGGESSTEVVFMDNDDNRRQYSFLESFYPEAPMTHVELYPTPLDVVYNAKEFAETWAAHDEPTEPEELVVVAEGLTEINVNHNEIKSEVVPEQDVETVDVLVSKETGQHVPPPEVETVDVVMPPTETDGEQTPAPDSSIVDVLISKETYSDHASAPHADVSISHEQISEQQSLPDVSTVDVIVTEREVSADVVTNASESDDTNKAGVLSFTAPLESGDAGAISATESGFGSDQEGKEPVGELNQTDDDGDTVSDEWSVFGGAGFLNRRRYVYLT